MVKVKAELNKDKVTSQNARVAALHEKLNKFDFNAKAPEEKPKDVEFVNLILMNNGIKYSG